MRIWISGGGTGGHVYPALTVLEAAGDEADDVVWFGTAEGMESDIVTARGIEFRSVTAAPLVGTSPWRFVANAARLALGTWQAWRSMAAARPEALLVTGGYASVPMAVAARARRIPLVVFLPDVLPGRAVRLLARLATQVAATSEASVPHLPPGRTVVTGYPVRRAVREARGEDAIARFALNPAEPVVLAFGGSRGARRLNDAVSGCAADLLERSQIIHVTGRLDHDRMAARRAALAVALADRYRMYTYLDDAEMADALACADLVVSRAGAAVMGEYPARGLPAVLVPLPIAGGHQSANAAVLADVGAARVIPDEDLDAPALAHVLAELLEAPERLHAMADAARTLDRPHAADRIWQVVLDTGSQPSRDEGGLSR